jgi:hypothetical protein
VQEVSAGGGTVVADLNRQIAAAAAPEPQPEIVEVEDVQPEPEPAAIDPF